MLALDDLPTVQTPTGEARNLQNLGYSDYWVTQHGEVYSTKRKTIVQLRNLLNPQGYRYVGLYVKGTGRHELVHRLVASAWVPNPQNKPHALHKLEQLGTANCDATNLFWGTQADNNADRAAKGRSAHKHGDAARTRKLADDTVIEAIMEIYGGRSIRDAALALGVNPTTLHHVLTGKNRRYVWKELPENVEAHYKKKYSWEGI